MVHALQTVLDLAEFVLTSTRVALLTLAFWTRRWSARHGSTQSLLNINPCSLLIKTCFLLNQQLRGESLIDSHLLLQLVGKLLDLLLQLPFASRLEHASILLLLGNCFLQLSILLLESLCICSCALSCLLTFFLALLNLFQVNFCLLKRCEGLYKINICGISIRDWL
jgi:hypothetical protein